ncbi:DUF1801 domain-containing protein [Arenibacterium sp. CAU 1754]
MTRPFGSPQVETAFNLPDPLARVGLLTLRDLIFETADRLPDVGPIEETLRWGQPAYLTPKTKSGTTLRLGVPKTMRFALFVHCQTSVIAEFTQTFPVWDKIDGTRAVLFDHPNEIDPLRHGWLITRALTYHKPQLSDVCAPPCA